MAQETRKLVEVIETALKNIPFMNKLIENPEQALKDRGWKVKPEEMNTLKFLLEHRAVEDLRGALLTISKDLKDSSVGQHSMTNVWLTPSASGSDPMASE